MDTITGLPGLFFIADEGETFTTGQVISAVGPDGLYFIRHDGRHNKLPMELATIDDMLGGERRRWEFFETREEMDAWIKLLDSEPEGPRVVAFPKK